MCVTIVRDDSPGSEGSIQASQHPEHAEPTQMFTTFIHLQELSEVGVHYRDGAANSGGRITRSALIQRDALTVICDLGIYDYFVFCT